MSTKHIEQCKAEELTSELFDIAYSDRAGDLVTSSLSKAYAETSGTEEITGDFTSNIAELSGALKILVNRLFSAPAKMFGDKSMSQMFGGVKEAYDWLRKRVKGSDGIPKIELPAIADAAHLVENLRVLDSRKIGTYDMEVDDGMSLPHLLCSSGARNRITKIADKNIGWTMEYEFPWSLFPNIKEVEFGCRENTAPIALNLGNLKTLKLDELEVANHIIAYGIKGTDIMTFPKLRFSSGEKNANSYAVISISECRILHFPELEEYTRIGNNSWLKDMPVLEELYMPKLSGLCSVKYGAWGDGISNCPNLKKVVCGTAIKSDMNVGSATLIRDCPNLIHLEFGEGTMCNIGLLGWSPTAVLTDEFIYNFQNYIADRLADMTGRIAPKIVLSSAVYEALEAQEGQTILATLTNKNWTIAQA